jgi:glycosyltransferase involved in cell wall biosynthesis
MFQQRLDVGLVMHPMLVIDKQGNPLRQVPPYPQFDDGWIGPEVLARGGRWRAMYGSALSFRREAAEVIFPIPQDFGKTDADNFIMRIGPLLTPISSTTPPLAQYRSHEHNSSQTCGRVLGTDELRVRMEQLYIRSLAVNQRLSEAGLTDRLLPVDRGELLSYWIALLDGSTAIFRLQRLKALLLLTTRTEQEAFINKVGKIAVYILAFILPRSRRAVLMDRFFSPYAYNHRPRPWQSWSAIAIRRRLSLALGSLGTHVDLLRYNRMHKAFSRPYQIGGSLQRMDASSMVIGHHYLCAEQPAGVPSEVRSLCRALGRAGADSVVITANGSEQVHYARCQTRYVASSQPVQLVGLARAMLDLRQHLDALVIYGAFTPHNLPVALLSIILRVPLVISPEGVVSANGLKSGRSVVKRLYWHVIEKPIMNRSSGLRVLSPFERDSLRALGVHVPMAVVREGVPEQEPGPVQTCARDARPVRTFLFLGRKDVSQKGLDVLIHGFLDALVEDDRGQRLLIAGPDDPGGDVPSLIANLKHYPTELRNRICLCPPVHGDAKRELMRSADVFIHPSRREGIPRVVREALAAGLPVIVTPETNLADLVARYRAGWVVAAQDRSIRDAILAAIDSPPEDVAAKSMQAQSLAERELSWDTIAASFVAFVKSVTTQHLRDTSVRDL